MQAGVSTACLYPMYVEEAFSALAERGIECTEVFLNSDCEMKKGFLLEMKRTADRNGVEIASVHPYTCGLEPMMFFTPYERRYLDILDYYKKYFEAMNILGAKIFVFHGNKPGNPCPEEHYFERFAGLAKVGKSFGITVAQENVSRCVSGKLSFLKSMSDYLGEAVSFVLDVKQTVRSGEDVFDYVRELGAKIVHIHFSDHGEKGDCLPFGEGNLDTDLFFSQLKANHFSGKIVLELYRGNFGSVDELALNYQKLKQSTLCF